VDRALSAYHDALDALFARTTGKSRLGLDRAEALLREMGEPHARLATFHVGGTNGKGSTCATLEALLRASGLRVARYTSPHLVDFRERMLVDGRPIAESAITGFVDRWMAAIERLDVSFFEATTAMALQAFAEAEVDVAVIEVGLGGRLDATNVVRPLAAGVTSIGIDHTEFLGDTREQIAFEKAGIFKRGVPAVIGEGAAGIRSLLAAHARRHGAAPVRSVAEECQPRDVVVGADGTRFTLTLDGGAVGLHTPLIGAHQASNAAVALLMLEAAGGRWRVAPDAAHEALRRVSLPGRFQRAGRHVFDVAHNAAGAEVTAATLRAVAPARPRAALLCVLNDKDWRGMMRALAPEVDCFVLTDAPTAPPARAWDLAEALRFARTNGWCAEAEHDFDLALTRASDAAETVLVTGSFHTVGDAMARLQVDPLAG
jgi:dihydrofolate synthase/folylpolyglutamate synthase